MASGFTYETLCTAGKDQLAAAMKAGVRPRFESICGYLFRGYNTPAFTAALRIRKFIKVFVGAGATAARPTAANDIAGYNIVVRQNRLADPWVIRRRLGKPRKQGRYRARPVDVASDDHLYPQALLLDYSRGGNPAWDPSSLLRDYLVQVDPRDDDLLLGKAFAALPGRRRVALSYFVLQRFEPLL